MRRYPLATDPVSEPFFSGPGLDRADALRADEAAIRRLSEGPSAKQLKWSDGLPQLTLEGRLEWEPASSPELFLGFDGEAARFSSIAEVTADARTAFPLMTLLSANDAPLFAAALSLSRWHCRHRFCANCGHFTNIVRGGWSRRCPRCNTEHYPRVDPVVIMLVECRGQLLLARQPHYPPGRYSALAGFVEVGENLEAAVVREVHEEVGIAVRNVSYIASQPWPFPSSLMIGCHATTQSEALTIDTAELEDARWFSREEIENALAGISSVSFQPPPRAAIARTLLERWLAS